MMPSRVGEELRQRFPVAGTDQLFDQLERYQQVSTRSSFEGSVELTRRWMSGCLSCQFASVHVAPH